MLGLTVVVSAWAMRSHAPTGSPFPKKTPDGEWVSSSACKSCHPGEHASWHRSWHRTMTQVASPETVLAPNVPAGVVLTTGSHHEQTYWVKNDKGELRLWPFVWLKDERKLISRQDAFLRPPDSDMPNVRWNSNCIQCHSTGGEPRSIGDHFETRVVELGIACEACHGPGGAHVEKHRDPIERWMARGDDKRDASIVNPAELDSKASAAVCGQCHSYSYPRDGAMTCTSCHSMHEGDPDDQLAPAKLGDRMCTQCHAIVAANHSHHAPGSAGSRCVECHMPMTSYALFTAIRSHRIENPRIGERLSACNLCHLDKTLAWTDGKLHDWYGTERTNPPGDVPASIVWALRGDAAERALAAAAMGRKESLDASGRDWEKPILDVLRSDPYAAVRFIAERSSKEVSGRRQLIDDAAMREEIAHRDDSPVTIAE